MHYLLKKTLLIVGAILCCLIILCFQFLMFALLISDTVYPLTKLIPSITLLCITSFAVLLLISIINILRAQPFKKILKCSFILFIIGVSSAILSNPINNRIQSRGTKFVENDFSFYSLDGKRVLFPTVDEPTIYLADSENLKTFKGIQIGDPASILLKHYRINDFKWEICDFTQLNPATEKAKRIEDKFKSQGKTTEEIMSMLTEISAMGLDVYLYCDIYKDDGHLCTEDQLDLTDEMEKADLNIPFFKDEDFRYEWIKDMHHKYTLSFEIDGEIISDVIIDSNYHKNLSFAYTAAGDLLPYYSWIEELK